MSTFIKKGSGKKKDYLPEQNAQRIIQNASELTNKLANLSEDTTPQLGGDLGLNGHNIDFPTTPNISDCIDDDTMATASATTISTSESIKAYADTKCQMSIGNYTGNNSNNRQITGLGFQPKWIYIVEVSGSTGRCWVKHEDFGTWYDARSGIETFYTAGHIKIISDGFEVDNADPNNWLNISGFVYYWVAFG